MARRVCDDIGPFVYIFSNKLSAYVVQIPIDNDTRLFLTVSDIFLIVVEIY